mmetsp:Transcript_778/g.1207  ORF Transcript_778/g.1207 Transcript_778/m.1207 type:complete len:547 (-) Transcript_778:24-1664(-)
MSSPASTTTGNSKGTYRLRQTVSKVSGWINTYRDISTTITSEELTLQRQEYWDQYIEKIYPEFVQLKDTDVFIKQYPKRNIPELETSTSRELNMKRKEEHKKILKDDLKLYMGFLTKKTKEREKLTGFNIIIRRFGKYLEQENASSIWLSQAELALNFHCFSDAMSKHIWDIWPVDRRYKSRSHQGMIAKMIFDELILFHEGYIRKLISTHYHEELAQKLNIFIYFYQTNVPTMEHYPIKEIISLFPLGNIDYIQLNLDAAIKTMKDMHADYKGFKIAFSEQLEILIKALYLVMECIISHHIQNGEDMSSLQVQLKDLHCLILAVFIASGVTDLIPKLFMIRFLYLDHLTTKNKKFLLELALGALEPLGDIAEMEVCDDHVESSFQLNRQSTLKSSPLTQQSFSIKEEEEKKISVPSKPPPSMPSKAPPSRPPLRSKRSVSQLVKQFSTSSLPPTTTNEPPSPEKRKVSFLKKGPPPTRAPPTRPPPSSPPPMIPSTPPPSLPSTPPPALPSSPPPMLPSSSPPSLPSSPPPALPTSPPPSLPSSS